MAEITLTRAQIRTIAHIAGERDKGWLELVSPPEGDLFDATYVEVKVKDAEGNQVEHEILTYAGVRPRAEAIPPEWETSDE